jgi:hypothetical protein
MFGSRVRVVAAAMVLAVVLGAALPTADHHGLAGLERGADRSSVVLADSSPLGVVASAVRSGHRWTRRPSSMSGGRSPARAAWRGPGLSA